jgi:hypothetical protein
MFYIISPLKRRKLLSKVSAILKTNIFPLQTPDYRQASTFLRIPKTISKSLVACSLYPAFIVRRREGVF